MSELTGWLLGYVVNAVWQVPLLFAAGWLAARAIRQMGAGAEHRVWVAVLVMQAALPACSLRLGAQLSALLRDAWQSLLAHGGGAAGGAGHVATAVGAGYGHSVVRMPSLVLLGVLAVYGCSVLYFAARLGWGLWRTGVMKMQAERVTLTGVVAQSWERSARRFGVAGAEVAESRLISGPVTVGIAGRTLLVPPGFLAKVSLEDLEAVFAHELAHMRRRDFLKNALYGMLSLPAAFHPVMWLTRARVAESREMVCDAMAADAAFGFEAGHEMYARSLLRLAAGRLQGTPDRTLHAIGIFDANRFERRVMNLTRGRVELTGVRRMAMIAACVVMGVATGASALALRMEVAAPSAVAADGGEKNHKVDPGQLAANSLSKKAPVYPAEAKAKGDTVNGTVVLAVTISKEGTVESIHVEKSLREDYDRSALEAVREWRWKPYLLNGEPTAVDSMVSVTYSLSK